jgi:hypothetical protein
VLTINRRPPPLIAEIELQIALRTAPFRRNVRRFLFGPASRAETAFEQEVLCPGDVSELLPSLFLDDQIAKIRGTIAENKLDVELDDALRRTATNAPTIAFHIRNATLLNGSLYASRMRYQVGNKTAKTNRQISHFDTAAICSSLAGNTAFGHWLADDVLTYVLAERHSKPICCSPNPPYGHMPFYAKILEQDWTATDHAFIDHLILFQDFAQTSLKKRRQLEARNKVLSQVKVTAGNHMVYLKRGNSGTSRLIANEQEIIDELSRRGFIILDINTDSVERILSYLATSRIVISMEGSQTYHGAYSLPSGSGLLLLQPPGRFVATQRGWSSNIGVRFGFVVGDERDDATYFSLNDILKTADLFFSDEA